MSGAVPLPTTILAVKIYSDDNDKFEAAYDIRQSIPGTYGLTNNMDLTVQIIHVLERGTTPAHNWLVDSDGYIYSILAPSHGPADPLNWHLLKKVAILVLLIFWGPVALFIQAFPLNHIPTLEERFPDANANRINILVSLPMAITLNLKIPFLMFAPISAFMLIGFFVVPQTSRQGRRFVVLILSIFTGVTEVTRTSLANTTSPEDSLAIMTLTSAIRDTVSFGMSSSVVDFSTRYGYFVSFETTSSNGIIRAVFQAPSSVGRRCADLRAIFLFKFSFMFGQSILGPLRVEGSPPFAVVYTGAASGVRHHGMHI
ncbi:hypothetical protein CC78DRAFT_576134 [Lojkania enalia]|uniref:Uncharacterized protein n=1 Tax=Lojkania enalia TaxID=147567 RepID=A0A9P4KHA7_9PLEO|nr:hypothetical protein CC78DRAFT_576134 [Didymosphaeria enalia]